MFSIMCYSNTDCRWNLTSENGEPISLDTYAFDLENHPTCSFDYLRFDGGMEITTGIFTLVNIQYSWLCHSVLLVFFFIAINIFVLVRDVKYFYLKPNLFPEFSVLSH